MKVYDECLILPHRLSDIYTSYLFFSFRLDTLQQSKARLELSNQTLKQQHQKELEGREEEVEQVRTAMNKKLKGLSQQLEDMHEEKQAAVKVGWHFVYTYISLWVGKGSSRLSVQVQW